MKKRGILIFLLSLFVLPAVVFAAKQEVSTEFEGVITANPGDVVAYDIKVTTSELKPSKYNAQLSYDENLLDLKGVTVKGEGWNNISDKKKIELTNKKGGSTGTTILATVSFKVKEKIEKQNIEIKLTEIKVTTLDDKNTENITSLTDKKVTLAVKSTDNFLKDLKVDGITIEGFKKDVYEYELTLDSSMEAVDVTATLNEPNATFVEEHGSREVNLDYGKNEVFVKVKSESGKIQVYKITINREDNRNTNNNLKEVIINSGKIKLELSKNKVDYTVKTYKLKELEVDAIPVDIKATVEVKIPEEIVVGDNVVVITVTSESGDEKLYTITFENSDTTIDTKIKTLYIKGYELDFDKNTMVYEVVFNKKFEKGLDIKVVPVSGDDLVQYTIYYNGSEITDDTTIKLMPGDKYEIKVVPIGLEEGEESDSKTYTIEIVKDTRVSFFLVLELFIMVILIILIIIQLVKRKNNKNSKTVVSKAKKVKVEDKVVKQEIDKTKVISQEELEKINNSNKE
jgi:hypothetical protein